MNIKLIEQNNTTVAVIGERDFHIANAQDALDMIATVNYEHHCNRIALYKSSLADDFFVLSTGMAGEVLQKFINFCTKLAIIGEHGNYTSKPLNDFIYECNNGNDIFFVETETEAVKRLSTLRS